MQNLGQQLKTHLLPVKGMSCASCAARVERALQQLPNVKEAHVNYASSAATVTGTASLTLRDLVGTVQKLGFDVPSETAELSITGMSCAGCARRVENALRDLPGVEEAHVNFATERASVHGKVPTDELIEAVNKTGKIAHRLELNGAHEQLVARREEDAKELKYRVILASLLGLPVFILEMGSHLIPEFHHFIVATLGLQASWIVQLILTTAVLFGPGRGFFITGGKALWHRAPDMNSLVALGTSAAYLFSVVATLAPKALPTGTAYVYFESASLIIILILAGRWLEARAKGRTTQAIQRLMRLAPKTAHVRRDGRVVELSLEQVVIGDLIEMRPGERLPVDGVIVEGSSYIDESMVTGEPMPIGKGPKAPVIGGTVNQTGSFLLRATAVGADTMLAQIIRMVETAQGGKLPIQALADRVTLYFVPSAMAFAALTFIVWMLLGPQPAFGLAVVNAVAVLIIACPCAMGLATPTSIMVGTGRGAEIGVLFRKGDALQKLKEARVIAFDKTGTLTEGAPTLTDFEVLNDLTERESLAMIAAVEAKSEHPIARAIVSYAKAQCIALSDISDFESLTGMGVTARIGAERIDIGSKRYMEDLGYDFVACEAHAEALAQEGKIVMCAAINARPAALIAVADPIKTNTAGTLQSLRALGLRIAMITGDQQRTATAIAAQLGIDEVIANVLPQGKLAAIETLSARFGPVVFVGDGINDAPALAQADIGIAIGTGTDIAIEAADIVLMSGDIGALPKAVALSRATLRNIKQNLFWAFAYNAALIPVAAGMLYPSFGLLLSPILAAGAMALSSVFVLGNALRMRHWTPAPSKYHTGISTSG